MKSLFDALNLVYNEPEKRSFIWLNIISLTFTVLAIVFALVAIGVMVVVPIVLNFLGLPGATEMVIKIARWPALFIVVSLALAFLYRYGPSREKPRWRWADEAISFAPAFISGEASLEESEHAVGCLSHGSHLPGLHIRHTVQIISQPYLNVRKTLYVIKLIELRHSFRTPPG
jgi:hypothetical protein